MKRLFLLLLLFSTETFSQRMSIFLKNDGFDVENRSFYINEIRDERKIKELGNLTINGSKVSLVCIPDLRFEVRNYLKKLLLRTNNQIPVNLVIKEFSLKETSDFSTEIVVVFDFYYLDTAQNKEILAEIANQKKIIKVLDKVENIEKALKDIIQGAIAELKYVQWSIYQKQVVLPNYVKPDPYTDVSLFLLEIGNFNRGFIMKGTYAHDLQINDETGVGRCFTYGFQFPYKFDNDEGWAEASFLVGGDYYKRIKNNWFGNLALHVPIGIVKTEKKSTFVLGLTSHQRFMSIKHYGAKFSFGTYQTISSHPFAPFGIGFTVGVGWANPHDND